MQLLVYYVSVALKEESSLGACQLRSKRRRQLNYQTLTVISKHFELLRSRAADRFLLFKTDIIKKKKKKKPEQQQSYINFSWQKIIPRRYIKLLIPKLRIPEKKEKKKKKETYYSASKNKLNKTGVPQDLIIPINSLLCRQ